jgi:hypothetical protein
MIGKNILPDGPPTPRPADGTGKRAARLMVIGLLAVDLVWGAHSGLSVSDWWWPALAVCLLLALSWAYRRRSRRLAETAESAALWIGFSATGCVLTYLGATFALPLQDKALAACDHAFGFDWLAWHETLLAWPVLHRVLWLVYASLMVQIVFVVLFLPAVGLARRGTELLLLAALTLLLTLLLAALWPALGPFATLGAAAGDPMEYLPDLLALRASGPWHFSLPAMQGIITMPSYHTVLAILFAYACRGTGLIGWGVAGLNALMLLSIPPIGGHYLIDMVAGAAIALLGVLALRWSAHSRRRMA